MKFPQFERNFWIICFALFFFIVSFNIIIPELNDYLSGLYQKGEYLKGLIIFLFSLSAAISRPFSGKLSDYIGRKKVMLIGAFIATVVCLIYPISSLIGGLSGMIFFLILRFVHGFSAGFLPTGATAMVTDILPAEKRSLGMGIWGTFISVGFGAGQILASWITTSGSINLLFFVAAGMAFITLLIVMTLKETLPKPEPFKFKHLKVKFTDVFDPPVMPAATVMFLSCVSTGILFVLAQEVSTFLDLNKGYFFGFYVLSTVFVRLFGSRISDTIGRRKTLIIGLFFMAGSMICLAFTRDITMFTISAIIFGLSTGLNSPTVFTWTADLSHIDRRGIGAGTVFIALELGIMLGSFSTIFTYDNTFDSISLAAAIGTGCSFLAIIYLFWHLKYRESKT
ncbi:MAG: MFS transporter [Crocinitomicaceae bacterium]|nr:MFS transporter [Crocinitomicaceae bacterium]